MLPGLYPTLLPTGNSLFPILPPSTSLSTDLWEMLLWVSSPCLLHIHLKEVQNSWPPSLKPFLMGREVRPGTCPALQPRPVAAARHWALGAARRRDPGLEPPAQPWSRPAVPAARPGAGPAAGKAQVSGEACRLGRPTQAGARAAATGASPPRDRLQSRCA